MKKQVVYNQNCHNCINRYPNYLNYDQGPCKLFEDEFGTDQWWEVLDFDIGCEWWEKEI